MPNIGEFEFLALHAPVRSDGSENVEPYAAIRARPVLESADTYSVVTGDFNLRSEMTYNGNFADRSVLTGATTKGA